MKKCEHDHVEFNLNISKSVVAWLQTGKINNKIFKGRVWDGNDEPNKEPRRYISR